MSIGQSRVRADGRDKVTGAAQYVDDLRPDGCLYGATVRSTRAHARIVGIRRAPDFDWSDVTLVTADDIPGENLVALMTDDQPALASGVTRHVTEAIALVAAPTRDKALAAMAHVEIDYEPLEPLFDPEAAEGHAIRIFGDDNVFSRIDLDHGDPAAVLADAETVIEGEYRVGLQEQLYLEPQGMIAEPREDGGVTITGSMQCPYYIIKALKRALGHDKLNVRQAVTGGGFGGKEEFPSLVAIHAALLAMKTGRPVKLIYRRDEDLRATTKRHPAIMRYRTAVDRATGKLLALDAHLIFDGGAYNTLSPVVLSRAVLHGGGPYACANVSIRGRMVATHTPPNGAFRGFGAPQAMFAVERHIDRIARTLGLDPLEVRRINLYADGDITPTGQVLTQVAATETFERALACAEKPVPIPAPRPGGGGGATHLARGRGLGLAWHGCGFTGNGEANLKGKADVALEGDRVVVYSGSTDIGQGTETIFPQIVAETLGIPVERVCNAPHDTALVPDSGPTVASRTAMVVGRVVLEAAEKLRAALEAEVGEAGLSFDELIARRKSDAVLRVRHEYADDGKLVWDPQTYKGDAYPTFGWTCVIVDLAVDLDTGEVFYERLVQATDVGRALNPVLASGQLEGGVLQALGYATCEEVVLDDQRCMRNDRLTNYIIPTALDAPPMETILVENRFEGGPFGAKGIGEIPMDCPAAAVAQAIERATGLVLDELPMTPERIVRAQLARSAT